MAEQTFETLLTVQLRAYADAGVRRVDRYTIAEGAIAHGRTRGIGWHWSLWRVRRPLTLVLVGLLVLALATSAAFVGGRLLSSLDGDGTYDAIFLRSTNEAPGGDIDIVAITSDGRERVVRRMDASMLESSGAFATYGSVSQDGWLAVFVGFGDWPRTRMQSTGRWALVDLTRPEREPVVIRYQPVIGGAWGPDGLFATTVPDSLQGFSIQVVDAETGKATMMPNLSLPGSGPDLIWAADGSGLVVTTDDGYAIAPRDGGPEIPGVPPLAPRTGARWLAPGGSTLYECVGEGCSAVEDGFVSTVAEDWTTTLWYDRQIDGALVRNASFAADGRSLWILLERVDGADHIAIVAKADRPGGARIVGTVNLGPGVVHMWFSGIAPDDSTVAIGHWLGELGGPTIEGPRMLVSTTGHVTPVDTGSFIGFMPRTLNTRPTTIEPSPTPPVDPVGFAGDLGALDLASSRWQPERLLLDNGRVLLVGPPRPTVQVFQ